MTKDCSTKILEIDFTLYVLKDDFRVVKGVAADLG
jgi:hypothetical protein